MWYEDFDDVLITWRDVYIKRKTQIAKIKEELMPVAWHPDTPKSLTLYSLY